MRNTFKAFVHFALAFSVIFTSAFAGTAVTFNGSPYTIPSAGETNWSSLSSFLISVANNAQTINKQVAAIRTATSTPVTITSTDFAVVTNMTVASAVSVTLPAGVTGQRYIVVDGKGDASTNNVTVTSATAQLINASASYVINEDRGGVTLQFDGTVWRTVEDYVSDAPRFTSVTAGTLTSTGAVNTATVAATGNISTSAGNLTAPAGKALVSSGTAAAPTFSNTAGTTGLYFPSDTVIGFASAGVARGTWSASGFDVLGSISSNSVAVPTVSSISTLSNKTLGSSNTITGATAANFTNSGNTITLPTSTSTLATLALSETLTNKTMGSTNTITGATSASFTNAAATVTLPTSTSTLATLALSETLTNKTITSPTITGATVTTGTINNTPIGGTTPAAGAFTTLSSSGQSSPNSLAVTNNATVGGTLGTTGIASFSAALRAANGSSSAPSYSFTGSTGTGIYAAATDSMRFISAKASIGEFDFAANSDVTTRLAFTRNVGAAAATYGYVGIDKTSGDTVTSSGADDMVYRSTNGHTWGNNATQIMRLTSGGALTVGPANFTGTQSLNGAVVTQNTSSTSTQYIYAKSGSNKASTYYDDATTSFNFYGYGLAAVAGKFDTGTGAWTIGPTAGAVHTINGQFKYGVNSNATGGTYNDFALPAGSSVLKFTNGGTLTGITGGTDGKMIHIVNVLATTLTLQNGSIAGVGGTGSSAANRILTGTGADVSITGEGGATLVYDGTDSRWRVIGIQQ